MSRGRGGGNVSCLQTVGRSFSMLYRSHDQKLNFGMEIECCCCEQPISNQKIILTAISLGAHNNNIRFPSQNSASANQRCRQSIHLSIRFQTSENEDGWLQRRLGFVPSCFVSLVSSRKPPYATARVDTLGWLAAPLTLCDVRRSTFRLQSGGLNSTADRSKVVERY